MKKPAVNFFLMSFMILAFNTAIAKPVCNEITSYIPNSSSLMPIACNDRNYKVLETLTKSGQFPDVSFLDICYISDPMNPIAAIIGNLPVTIKSISQWTNNFDTFGIPLIIPGNTGTIGTVVTQLSISSQTGVDVGKIFTRDTINFAPMLNNPPMPTPENLIIIGGKGALEAAKGMLKIGSETRQDGSIGIVSVTGKICISNE